MRLALNLNYSGSSVALDMDRILEAERLGYDSVWTAEAYGSDAVTMAAWVAARTSRIHVGTGIMQIAGRSPAMTAMTAMTLDALSGGRFRLGLGVSNPQVVEGWHGQAWGKPLAKTREYVDIVRAILRRDRRCRTVVSITRFPTRARTPRAWASRSGRSCTAAPICPSTSPPSDRGTWPSPPRSRRAGSRCTSRPGE